RHTRSYGDWSSDVCSSDLFYVQFRRAFPDFNYTVEELIAEGDRVAVRITGRYTHRGEFMGVAATGKPVVVSKMDIFRFAGGKMIDRKSTRLNSSHRTISYA